MNFEDYNKDCVWRTNKGSTYHTVAVEEVREDEFDMVSKNQRSRVMGNIYYCGAFGIECNESICAPFDFIKKYDKLQAIAREEFLGEL